MNRINAKKVDLRIYDPIFLRYHVAVQLPPLVITTMWSRLREPIQDKIRVGEK